VRGLDSDVGDGAYHAQPNVGTEDEPACEMETPSAGLKSFERDDPSYDSDQEEWRRLRCSRRQFSWGQVLGTGSRFLGEAQGASRKGCDGQKN
jgi:hypothetical protein